MSAETIHRNAAAAESRTRSMALVIQRAAERCPDQEVLKILAETTHIMLKVAQMQADCISRETAETSLEEFQDQASELEEQLMEGLRSGDSALEKLDQMHVGTIIQFAQHRLDAWEAAESEMRDLMNRQGLQDGA